jgi:hypothetical protein
MEGYVSGTGSIELDNDCQYSIDLRSTRSRESVVPKDDLAFYFNTYIEPKYGLGNINVSNVASFMKDLEMNWSKLTPELKDKVLNIMVDNILNNPNSNYDFKLRLLTKLGVDPLSVLNKSTDQAGNTSKFTGINNKSTFGATSNSNNGNSIDFKVILFGIVILFIILYLIEKNCSAKKINYSRLF